MTKEDAFFFQGQEDTKRGSHEGVNGIITDIKASTSKSSLPLKAFFIRLSYIQSSIYTTAVKMG